LNSNLSIVNTSNEIVMEWRKPEGGDVIDLYHLQWKHTNIIEEVFIPHISGQVEYSYIITNLLPETTYNIRLRGNNTAGWGEFTNFANLTAGRFLM